MDVHAGSLHEGRSFDSRGSNSAVSSLGHKDSLQRSSILESELNVSDIFLLGVFYKRFRNAIIIIYDFLTCGIFSR